MRLALIRHGESKHLHNQILSGPIGCQGLTDRGIMQAQALARRLALSGELSPCHVLLASPVKRALQTAEILAPSFPGCVIEIDANLTEQGLGEADGLPKAKYKARFGAFNPPDFPDRRTAPGGESWNEFRQRVLAVLERLEQRYSNETVVAVTHASFIVVSLLLLFNIPVADKRGFFDPTVTSLTEWNVSAGRWTLTKYNDCHHLLQSGDR